MKRYRNFKIVLSLHFISLQAKSHLKLSLKLGDRAKIVNEQTTLTSIKVSGLHISILSVFIIFFLKCCVMHQPWVTISFAFVHPIPMSHVRQHK